MPEKQQVRLEKKKKLKEAKGQEFNLNYAIAAHDIIVQEDGYLLLGEAFYPTYRTETRTTTTTTNGVTTTTTTTVQIFDGYQYTHAVLAKFGFDGNLLWDQCFEMWPIYKPYYVKRFIAFSVDEYSNIKMVFSNRNKLVSKTIDTFGNPIQDVKDYDMETNFEGDKTKSSFSDIDYWYDNYFISYGFQRIKNKTDDDVKKKRNVFFVSKVRFD